MDVSLVSIPRFLNMQISILISEFANSEGSVPQANWVFRGFVFAQYYLYLLYFLIRRLCPRYDDSTWYIYKRLVEHFQRAEDVFVKTKALPVPVLYIIAVL